MKTIYKQLLTSIGLGLLFIVPVYLSILLLFKGLGTVTKLVAPAVHLLPTWMQSKTLISLLVLLAIALAVGTLIRTRLGQRGREILERMLFSRIPGYGIVRSITERLAGRHGESSWKPALVETDDNALMPVFIIEELADGRYTVFVPSVPTPMAGSVFIYDRERVHPVDVPFTHALRVISHWGEGAKEFVAAMEKQKSLET